MVPPTAPLNLNAEAISGICGSISIACWVVVFSPQIIENFRRGNADGLSLHFIIVWLAGDVFNILGAVLQGVLPTMIILAVYYTIADIVLLGQCFYYRGFTWRDDPVPPPRAKTRKNRPKQVADVETGTSSSATEQTALLSDDTLRHDSRHDSRHSGSRALPPAPLLLSSEHRRPSWSALSPAVPFVPDRHEHHEHHRHGPSSVSAPLASSALPAAAATGPAPAATATTGAASRLQAVAWNALAVFMVCAAGVAGWYLSSSHPHEGKRGDGDDNNDSSSGEIVFSVWGQVFGYLCAVLYLGSRLPQLLLNWRRQSTEGVSMLFFLFACLGNLTYVLSIMVHDDGGSEGGNGSHGDSSYGRYLLVNLSWLAGSLGTLLLDMGIFIQFFLYQRAGGDEDADYADEVDDTDADEVDDADDATEVATAGDSDDDFDDDRRGRPANYHSFHEPILQRNMSN